MILVGSCLAFVLRFIAKSMKDSAKALSKSGLAKPGGTPLK